MEWSQFDVSDVSDVSDLMRDSFWVIGLRSGLIGVCEEKKRGEMEGCD